MVAVPRGMETLLLLGFLYSQEFKYLRYCDPRPYWKEKKNITISRLHGKCRCRRLISNGTSRLVWSIRVLLSVHRRKCRAHILFKDVCGSRSCVAATAAILTKNRFGLIYCVPRLHNELAPVRFSARLRRLYA